MKTIMNNLKLSAASKINVIIVTLLMSVVLIVLYSSNVSAGVETSFLYNLSDFSGPIPINMAHFSVDRQRNEIYVVDFAERIIRVFNEAGMEIYQFGEDNDLGTILDVAVKEDGNLLVLTGGRLQSLIIICDFRGKPVANLELKDLPPDFSGFIPHRIIYRRGLLYLLDTNSMRIIVADSEGQVQNGYEASTLTGKVTCCLPFLCFFGPSSSL
jgi:hypothetical protein